MTDHKWPACPDCGEHHPPKGMLKTALIQALLTGNFDEFERLVQDWQELAEKLDSPSVDLAKSIDEEMPW